MAEFTEVVKQAKRMCGQIADCNGCPLNLPEGCKIQSYSLPDKWDVEELEKAADIVMDWAAKHPEQRYPSWSETWRRLFPDARYTPCPESEFGIKMECKGGCKACLDEPIPADIAEKLGVKLSGGKDDA